MHDGVLLVPTAGCPAHAGLIWQTSMASCKAMSIMKVCTDGCELSIITYSASVQQRLHILSSKGCTCSLPNNGGFCCLSPALLCCRGQAFSCLCTRPGRQGNCCWHCCQSDPRGWILPGRPPGAEDSPVQSPAACRLCGPQHVARATEGSGDGMQPALPVWCCVSSPG